MCTVGSASLSSLDLFICWHVCLCPPPASQLSFHTVCPNDSRYSDSVSRKMVVFWLCPFSLFTLSLPQTTCMIFCLFLLPSRLRQHHLPLSQHSCQIKITSLKIQSTSLPQTARASLLAIHVFRCTLYHGGGAFGTRGSPTWLFHQNLMNSFMVTSKLCLFADNWDVYRGQVNKGADRHVQIGFLIGQRVALLLPAT